MVPAVIKKNFYRFYLFQPGLRIWHWVQFIAIFILFVTGLYIGDPFFIGSASREPSFAFAHMLSMDLIREIHFAAGYVLLFGFIYRIFLMFTKKSHFWLIIPKFWRGWFWKGIFEVILFYALIKKNHIPLIRNPLARTAYLFVLLLILFEIWTGFAMYGMSDPDGFWGKFLGQWTIALFGSEYNVHFWHHVVAWIIAIFVIVHVYMVFFNDFIAKEGELSSMSAGVKYFPEGHLPADCDDVAPKKVCNELKSEAHH
jgi:Ni/Fe-hydrogenase 1 B-type cytochrome subunit